MSDNEKDLQKNTRNTGPTAAKQAATTAGDDGSRDGKDSLDSTQTHRASAGDRAPVAERDVQYMITPRRKPALGVMGLASFPQSTPNMEKIHDVLQASENVTVVRRVRSAMLGLMSNGPETGSQDILVVRSKPGDTGLLARLSSPGLIVERDYLLGHLADATPSVKHKIGFRPLNLVLQRVTLQLHVQNTAGEPQSKAEIVLYSNAGNEAQGTTDDHGNASIVVPVGYINDIAALYVKPYANCWEHFSYRPSLVENGVNTVVLNRLPDHTAAGFADPATGQNGFLGWGQRLMGLSQVASGQMTGRGIKVAIVDSGCDNTHPALTHVRIGQDYTNLDSAHMPNTTTWTSDTMSHGTHCAGVIAGNGKNGHIRGFVPEAEVHVLKLFPGGAFNNLAAALHYCIDNQIDVVNCSLGGDQTSEAIEQLIDTARQAGVAVVVAAGNSGGAVQFPASVPGVMCVAAIGEQGEFPDNTYHARTCTPGTVGMDGLFPANFSCQGPQIDVCAPGVAVISSVPGGGYAAWDGTSMAAPAVTGLLAMVLAHHPEFAGRPVVRDASRIDRLFKLVAFAAAPLGIPPQKIGAGLPRVTSSGTRAVDSTFTAPMQGATESISQGQLQNIIRDAFLASLGVGTQIPPQRPQ